jgi:hypothetical protein
VTVRRPGHRINTLDGEQAVVIAAELVYHRETSRTVSVEITSIHMRENTLLVLWGPSSRPTRRSGSPAQLETGQLGERLGELRGEGGPQIDRAAIMADVDRQISTINRAQMGEMAPAAERFLSETRTLIEGALDRGHFPVHNSWSRYGEIRPPGQGAEVTVRRPGDRINTLEGERAVVIAAELVYHRETSQTVSVVIASIRMRENSLMIIQGPGSGRTRRSGSPAQLETGQLRERLGELQGEEAP